MAESGADAGWYSDPTHRGDHRFWDGQAWTDQISKKGRARKDKKGTKGVTAKVAPTGAPIVAATQEPTEPATPTGAPAYSWTPGDVPTEPSTAAGSPTEIVAPEEVAAETSTVPDSPTEAVTPDGMGTDAPVHEEAPAEASTIADSSAEATVLDGLQDPQPESPTVMLEPASGIPASTPPTKRGVRLWALVVACLGSLAIGALIGVLIQQSSLSSKDSTISALQHDKSRLTSERDAAQQKVDSRSAQQAADQAKAQRLAAEQQQAQQQAAAAAAAQAQQQAAAAAAAQAKKNTVPAGGGVFAVGTDINPGSWTTPGPDGSNGAGCYYAILNSPNTNDIANNNISNGQTVADLPAGKFFETSGCKVWTHQG